MLTGSAVSRLGISVLILTVILLASNSATAGGRHGRGRHHHRAHHHHSSHHLRHHHRSHDLDHHHAHMLMHSSGAAGSSSADGDNPWVVSTHPSLSIYSPYDGPFGATDPLNLFEPYQSSSYGFRTGYYPYFHYGNFYSVQGVLLEQGVVFSD